VNDVERMREALSKIADLARDASAADGGAPGGGASGGGGGQDLGPEMPGCSIRAVPTRLLRKAAENAIRINPVNAPMMAPVGGDSSLGVMEPMRIALLTAKYWGASPRRLTVSFMDSASSAVRSRILSHMNAWARTGCISFVETGGTGQVRITFGPTGHWSYLGTDILSIPSNRATMNLQAFDRETRDSEFFRVVRHETGHTLGFPHEHMRKELVARIDPQKAYAFFWQNQRWDRAMVDAQVLTSLNDNTIFRTAPDQTSIMCYQLPGSITRDGRPITGGTDINATDFAFNARIYPKQSAQTLSAGVWDESGAAAAPSAAPAATEDWPESEDVQSIAE
jgi:hypothetical protein